MVKDRLKSLQIKVGISCAEWSKVSAVPEATIRKILSGETPDPRFETVCKLTHSVGGSLDDIFGAKKETEVENNAVVVLKEAYESRIEALRERVEDLKNYAAALYNDKKALTIAVVILVTILVGLLVFDIALDTNGWFQR
jgi:predicted transcriptional regulator